MKGDEIFSNKITVIDDMAASRIFEGAPHVFGTPSLVGFIEVTAHKAIKNEIRPGQTSVGLSIELVHFSPTPIGMEVRCDVKIITRDGSKINFDVEVFDAVSRICTAKHTRAIVDEGVIEAKAEKKLT